jgi:hypothetical protein
MGTRERAMDLESLATDLIGHFTCGRFTASDHQDAAIGIVDEPGQRTFLRSQALGQPDARHALTFCFLRWAEEDQLESHHKTNWLS